MAKQKGRKKNPNPDIKQKTQRQENGNVSVMEKGKNAERWEEGKKSKVKWKSIKIIMIILSR